MRLGLVLALGLLTVDAASAAGKLCGSRGLKACSAGQFCNFPLAARCGETDRPGRCMRKPQVCTMDYRPVCGCDGKTYSNACAANGSGVSVRHIGECR